MAGFWRTVRGVQRRRSGRSLRSPRGPMDFQPVRDLAGLAISPVRRRVADIRSHRWILPLRLFLHTAERLSKNRHLAGRVLCDAEHVSAQRHGLEFQRRQCLRVRPHPDVAGPFGDTAVLPYELELWWLASIRYRWHRFT